MTENNPVNELIQIEKENQQLLKELIDLTKARKHQGTWKLIIETLKMIMWPAILILSFYFSMQMIKEFTTSLAEKASPTNIIEQISTGETGGLNNILDLLSN